MSKRVRVPSMREKERLLSSSSSWPPGSRRRPYPRRQSGRPTREHRQWALRVVASSRSGSCAAEPDVEMVDRDGVDERERLWRMEVLGWPRGTLTALVRGRGRRGGDVAKRARENRFSEFVRICCH
jgi:hypothetical protein